MSHIIVHADRIVAVDITLFHLEKETKVLHERMITKREIASHRDCMKENFDDTCSTIAVGENQ